MEINDLRIFQVVAYEKSISRVASKLGYAQSNITMRIKLLENKLNTTLFIRNNKGIKYVTVSFVAPLHSIEYTKEATT